MDDKEYYNLMNRPSSWNLQQALKKARQKKKDSDEPPSSYSSLEVRQGKADAEMLMEKKS